MAYYFVYMASFSKPSLEDERFIHVICSCHSLNLIAI